MPLLLSCLAYAPLRDAVHRKADQGPDEQISPAAARTLIPAPEDLREFLRYRP